MRKWTPHALLWAVGLLPALIGGVALPSGSFGSASTVLDALGRLAGLGGLGLMLVAAIVSFRIPGFDRLFGGLTSLWRTHHLMGGVAFLLLLGHPLLLALAASAVSLDAALEVLFAGDIATWLGWGALLVMMVFLAPSFEFFGSRDYQRWKSLHKLAGISVMLALTHAFLQASTIPEPWSTLIWAVLALAALTALAYGLLFARRASQYSYTVAEVARPANNVVELSLKPVDRQLRHRAGQFVYLTPCDSKLQAGYREEHPYTLTSSSSEQLLRVAIKDVGDASRAIQSIALGSEVQVMGPYGAFLPAHNHDAELWIAGGIGIAPFLGRARELASRGEAVNIHLIYCVQDEARALFSDELRRLSARIPGFSFAMHYFYRDGPLSSDFVRYHCPDCATRKAYVCGPARLSSLARKVLVANGMPRGHFKSEEFTLL
ncbi:MAG: ferric reductase-like transmembrane domain-containing protein [Porticoccaceae bacterium]|nr:ferric reductase-like transmembrane domain-containing protein [Porticoccaceae bacterium]